MNTSKYTFNNVLSSIRRATLIATIINEVFALVSTSAIARLLALSAERRLIAWALKHVGLNPVSGWHHSWWPSVMPNGQSCKCVVLSCFLWKPV